ncbi:MAG TPA: gamma-glutamyl-gamma-aminobutyrate hydrolase family protein [Acidimicrobiia bacterium]
MPSALVLANRDDADAGLVGVALDEHRYRLTLLAREDAEDGWPDDPASGADLVLVLGSDWSVYADEVRAPVTRERDVLAAAVAREQPVLAICFGAQLLATALGGAAGPAGCTELGWREVVPVDSSIEPGPWFQFHSDTFTLPPEATLLAESDPEPVARAGLTAEELVSRTAQEQERARLAAHRLVTSFLRS